MSVRLWDLTGALSCSFQSFIIPACQAWSWASVCSYMYIKTEEKGDVLIINFLLLFIVFVCFFNSRFVYRFAFALWDAQRLKEKKHEKHFGENNHKPPDCATKETSDTDAYSCPHRKQTTKSHLIMSSLFYLFSLPHPPFSPSLSCVCVLVVSLLFVCNWVIDLVWFALLA